MRSIDDLIRVNFNLSGRVSLDWERIIEDPVWAEACIGFHDLSDPVQRSQALRKYISHYIGIDLFLSNMPSTNGPGTVWLENLTISMENNDGTGSSSSNTQHSEQTE